MPDTSQGVIAASLPIDKVKSAPHQARTVFDEASLQELAGNLKEHGLIQPVSVRPLADGTWELIAGERRLRAAKLLGWPAIDARVFPNITDQEASLMGLVENLQRVDLNPIEKAKGYKLLSEPPYSMSVRDIAKMVGKDSHSGIVEVLSLLDQPPEIKELVSQETISPTHCRPLAEISDANKRISLARQAGKEGWSVKETEKRVNQAFGKPSPNPLPKGRGPTQGTKTSAFALQGEGGRSPDEGSPPDPLAELWSKARGQMDESSPGYWEARYGPWAMAANKELKQVGWTFSFAPFQASKEATRVTNLAAWFRQMAEAVGAACGEENHPSPNPLPKGRGPTAVGLPPMGEGGRRPDEGTISPAPKPRGVVAQRVAVPVPEIEEAKYVAGDRMQLRWPDLGKGFQYRILYSYDSENPSFKPVEEDRTVETPGAIVDVYACDQKEALLAVQAIDPEGHLSDLSQPVQFELKSWNKEYSVKPLPPTVIRPPVPTAAPVASASPVPDGDAEEPRAALHIPRRIPTLEEVRQLTGKGGRQS